MIQKLKGSLYSKSAWLGLLITSLGLLEQFYPTLISQLIPNEYAGMVASLFGIIIWLLRWVTTKPLDEKE